MRNKTLVGIALLVLAQGLSGCDGSDAGLLPLAPSSVPVEAAVPPAGPRSWMDAYTLTGVSLSGVVYESTPEGPVPIAGAGVYCELCGELTHTWTETDADGFYVFPGDLTSGGGVWLSAARSVTLLVRTEGYRDPAGFRPVSGVCPSGFSCREVVLDGDTRFDVELVRR